MSTPAFAFNTLTQPSSTTTQTLPSNFDASAALLLAQCCGLTYTQYAQGTALTSTQIASALTAMSGYTYTLVASFTGVEAMGPGAASEGPGAFATVPYGFALQASQGGTPAFNILALRGTLSWAEWFSDANVIPVAFALDSVDTSTGHVHGGFYGAYTLGAGGVAASSNNLRPSGSIAAQVQAAMTSLYNNAQNTALPLYVTGHSLGAALSVLCAMDVAVNSAKLISADGLSLYSFACPRVSGGLFSSPTQFVTNFQKQVPNNFHIANMADVIPTLPLPALQLGSLALDYYQVFSNTLSYCAQLGSVASNHSLAENYLPYATQLQSGYSSAQSNASLKKAG
ncbi:lipase family protein [Pyxidicoccus parkwayensis]|uniref:Lipase family protein n=1 Tax=Pyxidicoccus parkwayensis TaxID=2813578 RepID=A0ABX7NS72_9BACT|nr:lipase family protein [Pyxidicoccus parkwaysis]QSQ21298.1 lipase family protein [Pyxidicoccus parkwaysis]